MAASIPTRTTLGTELPLDIDLSQAGKDQDLVLHLAPPSKDPSPRPAYGTFRDWPIHDNSFVIANLPHHKRPSDSVFIGYQGVRAYVQDHPAWNIRIEAKAEPHWEVRDTGGAKGQGLFAREKINVGDIVLIERPILFATAAIPTLGNPSPELQALADELDRVKLETGKARKLNAPAHLCTDTYGLIDCALDRLTPERKAAYLSLKNSKPAHGGIKQAEGVLRTNVMGIPMPGSKVSHGGVAEMASRINHSCVPNTDCFFDHLLLAFKVTALRPIEAGEEITISYIDKGPRKERRGELLRKYHFDCTCSACSDPKIEASYEQRTKDFSELQRLHDDVARLLEKNQLARDAIRAYRRLARKMYGAFGPEHDDRVPVGGEMTRLDVLTDWLAMEMLARTDPETMTEVAMEGRRLMGKLRTPHCRNWRMFNAAMQSAGSIQAVAAVAASRDWL